MFLVGKHNYTDYYTNYDALLGVIINKNIIYA